MNRLFLKIAVALWLISIVSLISVLALNYVLGVFPPVDEQARGRSDFGLAFASALLARGGEEPVLAFARLAGTIETPLYITAAKQDGAACDTAEDDARSRLVRHDGDCWQLTVINKRPSWLTVSIAKLMPLIATVLTSLAASLWIVRYFTGPLGKLRDGLAGLANGDFSRRLATDPAGSDELALVARDFDQTALRLQEFQEGQQRLFHHVSHELRSPLSRLQAAIGMLRLTPNRQAATLQRMETEIDRLDALVEEILTLARLNTRRSDFSRQRIDVIDLVSDIVEDACFEGQAKDVRVIYDGVESFIAEVNGELIYRAIENIVRNAVKYSPSASQVVVLATASANQLCLAVEDSGPGVPEGELETIFGAFIRASDNVSTPGHGLGLAIARQAARLHGGDLLAMRREAAGLKLMLTLPSSLPVVDAFSSAAALGGHIADRP
jgi:signal transduction histidine kinase